MLIILQRFSSSGLCFYWYQQLNLQDLETVTRRCSVKSLLWIISQNSQENTCVGVSFRSQVCNVTKKLQQSCFPMNFAKILRTNTNFVEHLWAAAWRCWAYGFLVVGNRFVWHTSIRFHALNQKLISIYPIFLPFCH